MELISIILPCFNGQLFLERCLDSINNQTITNWELIIIDDGSTDDSKKIIEEKYTKFTNIRYMFKENGGVSSARNEGLKVAKGNYIFFMDVDDYLEKDTLEVAYEAMKSNDCNLVFLNYFIEENNKKSIFPISINSNLSRKYLIDKFVGNYFFYHVWGYLVEKSLIQNMKFDENYILGEDMDFNLKVIKNLECKPFLINQPKYHYVINGLGATKSTDFNKIKIKVENLMKIYENHYEFLKQNTSENIDCKILKELYLNILPIFISKNKKSKKMEELNFLFQNPFFKSLDKNFSCKDLSLLHQIGFYLFRKNDNIFYIFGFLIYKNGKILKDMIS